MKSILLAALTALALNSTPLFAESDPEFDLALVREARAQVGLTTIYDPSYVGLVFPNGDFDRTRGVCSDVVIRALRDTAGIDLQALVNADMKRNFAAYPTIWGLTRTDRNIDHRRVPNLETFFARKGVDLEPTQDAAHYLAGDIVSWRIPGNLPHIGIVSDQRSADGTPLILHNIGAGTQEEDVLFKFKIIGHYRPTRSALN